MMDNEEGQLDELAPWLVIAITLAAAFLRFLLPEIKGLRLEETLSVWVSRHSIADMLPWIVNIDHQPPLYYLLLHYWIKLFGDTPYYLRLLSVLFGAGTIPIIYLIGKRLSGAVVGVAAAVLLALSPFNIRLAQETRAYTLLAFNAALAIYALVWLLSDPRASRPVGSQFREYLRAWRTPGPVEPEVEEEFSYKIKRSNNGWKARLLHPRWVPLRILETDLAWIAFIVFSAATLYSHNSAVLFPLATNTFVLGLMLVQRIKKTGTQPAFQAPSFQNWVMAQVGILLLWSPWIGPFFKQAGRVFQEFWIPPAGWSTVVKVVGSFLNQFSPGQSSEMVLAIWILFALVLGLGLVHYFTKISRFLFLVTLFAIPILGELLVSLRRPVFFDRTLIWVTIPLILLLASGIAQVRYRIPILIVLGILGSVNLLSASDYYKAPQAEQWDKTAGFVANFVQKGDLILFNATWVQVPFDYYFVPWEKQYFLQVEKHGVPADLFDRGVFEPKMTESDIPRLASLLSGHKTVWLVYSTDQDSDPMGLIPQALATGYKLIYTRDYTVVQVLIYAAP